MCERDSCATILGATVNPPLRDALEHGRAPISGVFSLDTHFAHMARPILPISRMYICEFFSFFSHAPTLPIYTTGEMFFRLSSLSACSYRLSTR